MSLQTTSARTGFNPLLLRACRVSQKSACFKPDIRQVSEAQTTAGYVSEPQYVTTFGTPASEETWAKPEATDLVFASCGVTFDLLQASFVTPGYTWTPIPETIIFTPPQEPVFIGCTLNVENATSGFVSSVGFDPVRQDQNLAELETLYTNADEDWVTPTAFAYATAITILQLCAEAPVAFMTTDSEGGIRMAWRQGDKQVRVNIGARPDLRSYIYFESSEAHGIEDLQVANLQERLRWLGE